MFIDKTFLVLNVILEKLWNIIVKLWNIIVKLWKARILPSFIGIFMGLFIALNPMHKMVWLLIGLLMTIISGALYKVFSTGKDKVVFHLHIIFFTWLFWGIGELLIWFFPIF